MEDGSSMPIIINIGRSQTQSLPSGMDGLNTSILMCPPSIRISQVLSTNNPETLSSIYIVHLIAPQDIWPCMAVQTPKNLSMSKKDENIKLGRSTRETKVIFITK